VFMPEHVHLLIDPANMQEFVSRFLARVKQPFSRQIHALLADSGARLLDRRTVRERPGKTCFRFWQEGPGFDRNLYSPEAIFTALDYIHSNPVKRNLCPRAVDWNWSSARFYLAEFGNPTVTHPRLNGKRTGATGFASALQALGLPLTQSESRPSHAANSSALSYFVKRYAVYGRQSREVTTASQGLGKTLAKPVAHPVGNWAAAFSPTISPRGPSLESLSDSTWPPRECCCRV
jgi:REP element-mobilizing transposase RayT